MTICDQSVCSIKRVMTTNSYIIKTMKEVKLLSIDDLTSQHYSLKVLVKANDVSWSFTDSLQVQVTPFNIVIATGTNEIRETLKGGAKVIKLQYTKI